MHLLRPGTRLRQVSIRGRAFAGVVVPANAALWDDGTPMLWDDGSLILWV